MRIWLDTLVLAKLANVETLDKLIANGNILVIANTAVDVSIFQTNLEWLEGKLLDNSIVIEIWNTPDEMVAKPFFWSSRQQETPACKTFAEAIETLEDSEKIAYVANLVEAYGLPKGQWKMGEWAPPEPLSESAAKYLGIPAGTSNRTAILDAAVKTGYMNVFNEFNTGYCRGLAKQHCCNAILNIDGSCTEI